jgi:hypothetical protein
MNPWEQLIWRLNILLTAAVLANLWRTGLARKYKLFFIFFAADFIQSTLMLFVGYGTSAYAEIYFPTQAIKISFSALLLIEIYSLVLQDYPALARFGKATVGYLLLTAAILAAAGLLWKDPSSAGKQILLTRGLLVERTLNGTMVVFEILVALFLAWFPVRIRHNELLIIAGLLISFLSRAAVAQLVNRFQGNHPVIALVNTVYLIIVTSCLGLWLLGLRREGESRTAILSRRWSLPQANRLICQLEDINSSLERIRVGCPPQTVQRLF